VNTERIDSAFLVSKLLAMPAVEVARYIEEHNDLSGRYGWEEILLGRDKLIDLQLAKFSRDSEILSGLYRSCLLVGEDDPNYNYYFGLMLACLSNETNVNLSDLEDVIGEELLRSIVNPEFSLSADASSKPSFSNYNKSLQRSAILNNKNYFVGYVNSLFCRKDYFEGVSESTWVKLIKETLDCNWMVKDYSYLADGVWYLIANAPANRQWKDLIKSLMVNIFLPTSYHGLNNFDASIVQRWDLEIGDDEKIEENYNTYIDNSSYDVDEFFIFVYVIYGGGGVNHYKKIADTWFVNEGDKLSLRERVLCKEGSVFEFLFKLFHRDRWEDNRRLVSEARLKAEKARRFADASWVVGKSKDKYLVFSLLGNYEVPRRYLILSNDAFNSQAMLLPLIFNKHAYEDEKIRDFVTSKFYFTNKLLEIQKRNYEYHKENFPWVYRSNMKTPDVAYLEPALPDVMKKIDESIVQIKMWIFFGVAVVIACIGFSING
jgi:hypothetical protein